MKFYLTLTVLLSITALSFQLSFTPTPDNRREIASIDELYSDEAQESQEQVDCVQCQLIQQQQQYLSSFNNAFQMNQQILLAMGQGNAAPELSVYQQMDQITAQMLAQSMPQMNNSIFATPVLNQLYLENYAPQSMTEMPSMVWGDIPMTPEASNFSFVAPRDSEMLYQRFDQLQGFNFANDNNTEVAPRDSEMLYQRFDQFQGFNFANDNNTEVAPEFI